MSHAIYLFFKIVLPFSTASIPVESSWQAHTALCALSLFVPSSRWINSVARMAFSMVSNWKQYFRVNLI